MSITVKKVGGPVEKSAAEKEQELLAKKQAEDAAREKAAKEAAEQKQDPEPVELKDEDVLSYINKTRNKGFKNIDELFVEQPKPLDLGEDIKKYLEFQKDTGRGMRDFVLAQEDTSSLPENERIRRFLSDQNPGLDADDISFMMNKKFGYDDDADEDEIRQAGINKKNLLTQADEHFNSSREKYKTPLESKGLPPKEDEGYKAYLEQKAGEEQRQKAAQNRASRFEEETNKLFGSEFEGFKFKIGEEEVTFKSGETGAIKDAQSDIRTFLSKFMDEDGVIKDPRGYHRAINAALNADAMAEHFYKLGEANAAASRQDQMRNNQRYVRKAPETSTKEGVTVKAADSKSGRMTMR